MKIKIFTFLLICAAFFAGLFYYMRSDAYKIKKKFHQLAEQINKSEQEPFTSTIYKSLTIADIFCPNVSFNINDFPYNGTHSAEVAVSLIINGRKFFNSINIRFIDMEFQLTDPETAKARCSAKVHLSSSDEKYGNFTEVKNFKATLKKIENSWKFASFEEDNFLVK